MLKGRPRTPPTPVLRPGSRRRVEMVSATALPPRGLMKSRPAMNAIPRGEAEREAMKVAAIEAAS
jgi:hypothetical protein